MNIPRRLDDLRGSEGWTKYTDASVDLEYGEWARRSHDLARAEHHYRLVLNVSQDEPVHRSFAMLGLAETARQQGMNNQAWCEQVRKTLTRHPMGYIASHLAITEYLSGRVSADVAVSTIRTAMPDLRPRTTKGAVPEDFCLGTRSGVHELYLP